MKPLPESKELFRSLFEFNSDSLLLADIESRKFIHANRKICEMLGYTEEELLQLGVTDIHPREHLPWVFAEFEKQAKKLKILAENLPVLRKDGTVFYADINTTPVQIDGRMCNLGMFRDITHRKETEEMARRNEIQFRTLVGNIPGMVYRGDRDWHTEYISGTEEICGYALDDFKEKKINWRDIIHSDDRERVFGEAVRLTEGQQLIQEYRIKCRDGRFRWVEDRKTPRFSGIVYDGVDGVVFDITERKEAGLLLAKSLKEKELLLREIHHRVKNNLNMVSNLLFLQLDRTENETVRTAFLNSQQRILAIAGVHDLLYQNSDLERIDMRTYVRNLLNIQGQTIALPQNCFRTDVDEIYLTADEAMSCGLMLNELVTNALKYCVQPLMAAGKSAVVSIGLKARDSGKIELSVRDNGPGMNLIPDLKRTESLGLRLAGLLTEQLNGEIKVETASGKGFSIVMNFKPE